MEFFLNFLFRWFIEYRNAANVCVLILNLAPLLHLFLCSNIFFIDFLGFSTFKITFSVNRDNFLCSYPVLMALIYFYCLIALTGSSSTMLTEVIKEGILSCSRS